MKKKIAAAVLLLLIAGVLYLLAGQRGKEAGPVKTSGIVEGTEVNIAPKAAGKISEVCCSEGDRVSAGQTIVSIESDDLRAAVDQSLAAVARAKANAQAAEAQAENARANLKNAEALLKSFEADREVSRLQMDEAKKERDRASELFRKDFISRSSLDQAVSVYDTSVAAEKASAAKVNASVASGNAVAAQIHTAVGQLTAARAAEKEAAAALNFSKSRLADSTITSPVSGTVVYKALEKGETVNPGSVIMTIVELDNLYVRVDIEETFVGFVTIGSGASVTVEAMPGRVFKGKVYEIGRYGDFATQRDVTRGRQDIKTFRVKIRVEDKEGILKPGMTVAVEIPKKK